MEHLWGLKISQEVLERITSLHPEQKFKVRSAIDQLRKDPHWGKPLEDELSGYWSYKVKPYRVIYKIQGRMILVKAIGHRREVYEIFSDLVRQGLVHEALVKPYGRRRRPEAPSAKKQ